MLTGITAARGAFVSLAVAVLLATPQPAGASSEFTYQGQLQFGDQPVNTTCSFEFSLWSASFGGTQYGSTLNRNDVTVTNGLFTVELDFGGTALGSGSRWLQTSVNCVGHSGPGWVNLSRQPLTAAPYAYSADTVVAGGVGNAQLASGAVTAAKIATGAVTASAIETDAVNSAEIASGAVGTAEIATGAVTSAKIQDGTITASDVNTSSLQRRVTGTCAANWAMTSIEQTGDVSCTPIGGTITEIVAGNGLTGGGTTGTVSLAVEYGSDGSSTSVPRADHTHRGQVWTPFIFPSAVGLTVENTTGVGLKGTSTDGTGVEGVSTIGHGVTGTSSIGAGVGGVSTTGHGVTGTSTHGYGVYGLTDAEKQEGEEYANAGVTGESSASGGIGVRGISGSEGAGVLGTGSGVLGYGVMGTNPAGGGVIGTGALGVMGLSETRSGVYGWTNSASSVEAGVFGEAPAAGGTAIRAVANNGTTAWAVLGESTSGWAGYFKGKVYVQDRLEVGGNLNVTGDVNKGGGGFKIDHPLDPANKYLSHSFVESPDRRNLYDGIAVLDDAGEAVVTLPDWFEALNRDFRYQLTCVGGFAPVYIAEEIAQNRFRIAGGEPGLKVSWQVTGVRQDAFATAHPFGVEEEKPADEQGLYLYPEEHGQPEALSIAKSKEAAK